jgi:hypothetical protein
MPLLLFVFGFVLFLATCTTNSSPKQAQTTKYNPKRSVLEEVVHSNQSTTTTKQKTEPK